jgi:apolipoprotein N-acyltransferase
MRPNAPGHDGPSDRLASLLIPSERPSSWRESWKRWPTSIAAVAVSAALIVAATDGVVPSPQPILAWIAFAPWLAATVRHGPRGALVLGLLMGFAWFMPGRWDVPGVPAQAISDSAWAGHLWTLAFFLSYALPFAIFGWADARWLRQSAPSALQPVVRAGVLATLICVVWTPFAVTPASMVVDYTRMIQISELGGEAWLLWLVLLPSAALGELFHHHRLRAMVPTIGVCALLLVACSVAGSLRIHYVDLAGAQHPSVSIMALQLQLDPHSDIAHLTANRSGRSVSGVERSRDAFDADPSCRFAVWPETPLPQERAEFACRRVPELLDRFNVPLLMQCRGPHGAVARLYRRAGQAPLEHAKTALVPVYETTLWRGLLGIGDGPPGTVMPVGPDLRVIPAVCYEVHSHSHLAAATRGGGNMIAHMASFNAFGGRIAERYDLAMTRILAVSYRTPVVRSVTGDTGGWIDATGRLQRLAPDGAPAAQCKPVELPNLGPTLFARLGTWMSWLPGLIGIAVFMFLRRRRRTGHR